MRDRCAESVNALPDVTVRDSLGTFEDVGQPCITLKLMRGDTEAKDLGLSLAFILTLSDLLIL